MISRAHHLPPLDPLQTFDGVVVFDTKFSPEVIHIADELQSLVTYSGSDVDRSGSLPARFGSSVDLTGSSSNAGLVSTDPSYDARGRGSEASRLGAMSWPSERESAATTSSAVSTDLMRVQLQDLLYKVVRCLGCE